MRDKIEIAFRRKVRAVWLDQGMELAADEVPWKKAKASLAKEVAAENAGTETIRKVLEHVRRIWFEPPNDSIALRSQALKLFRAHNSRDTRFLLNWGMAIAAYPFVGSVGEALGRLLKLQKEARRSDVQRRLREQYGDRDFVNRITRYVISSFLDWGVVTEKKRTGVYVPGRKFQPRATEQLAWMAEAVLISRNETQMSISKLCQHPILFPVSLELLTGVVIRENPRLEVSRHSLNEEFIGIDTAGILHKNNKRIYKPA
jgi:hypothetical protein